MFQLLCFQCSMPSLVFISLRACLFLTDVYSLHWCLFKTLPIYLKSAHTECWCTTLPNWLSWKINSERLFQQQTGWYSYSFPTFIYVPHKHLILQTQGRCTFSAAFRILGTNLIPVSLSPLESKNDIFISAALKAFTTSRRCHHTSENLLELILKTIGSCIFTVNKDYKAIHAMWIICC